MFFDHSSNLQWLPSPSRPRCHSVTAFAPFLAQSWEMWQRPTRKFCEVSHQKHSNICYIESLTSSFKKTVRYQEKIWKDSRWDHAGHVGRLGRQAGGSFLSHGKWWLPWNGALQADQFGGMTSWRKTPNFQMSYSVTACKLANAIPQLKIIWMTGGASRSATWNRPVAAVTMQLENFQQVGLDAAWVWFCKWRLWTVPRCWCLQMFAGFGREKRPGSRCTGPVGCECWRHRSLQYYFCEKYDVICALRLYSVWHTERPQSCR